LSGSEAAGNDAGGQSGKAAKRQSGKEVDRQRGMRKSCSRDCDFERRERRLLLYNYLVSVGCSKVVSSSRALIPMGGSWPDSSATHDTKCMVKTMPFLHGLADRSMPFTARSAKRNGTSHAYTATGSAGRQYRQTE
jgi:hypothetical protein